MARNEMFGVTQAAIERHANFGSRGWSAFGAFFSRPAGAYGGSVLAALVFKDRLASLVPTPEEVDALNAGELTPEEEKAIYSDFAQYLGILMAGNVVGGSLGAALGSAMLAPSGLRGRAALGAALGGIVPIFGAPLAALGAYVATDPSRREKNPMSTAGTVAATVAATALLGGLSYGAWRIQRAKAEKAIQQGD